MKVVSGDFIGIAECEYDRKEWNRFVLELEQLYRFEKKEVIFKDICYGSEILFAIDDIGHINVKGLIYGLHMTHSMEFEFDADQTILPIFIGSLKEL